MSVPFTGISPTVRLPLFHIDFDPSRAGSMVNYRRILLLGHQITGAPVVPLTQQLSVSVDASVALFGAGSMLSRMLRLARGANAFDPIVCMAVPEPAAGVKATGTITFTAAATAAGTLSLYIAGQRVQIAVAAGDAAAEIATKVSAAINLVNELPVVATVAAAVVTLTCKWKGLTGNGIDVQFNFRGAAGGEAFPAGVTAAIVAMASGTGSPDLAPVFAALGDDEFETIIHAWTDSASLDAFDAEFAHNDAGRWGWIRQLYGHVFSAADGTVAGLQTLGAGRNGGHQSTWGYRGSPNPSWERAAARYAVEHRALMIDPARPVYTLPIPGIMAAPRELRFKRSERNDLLFSGMSTAVEQADGTLVCEQSITHYQKNPAGVADDGLLKVQTLYTSAYVHRSLRFRIVTRFPRHKIANDGTRVGPGQPVLTPNVCRGELIAHYGELEYDGLVENVEAFKANLIVERDTSNANRMNVLYPPDLINQLDVFAVLNQFRLQYATTGGYTGVPAL